MKDLRERRENRRRKGVRYSRNYPGGIAIPNIVFYLLVNQLVDGFYCGWPLTLAMPFTCSQKWSLQLLGSRLCLFPLPLRTKTCLAGKLLSLVMCSFTSFHQISLLKIFFTSCCITQQLPRVFLILELRREHWVCTDWVHSLPLSLKSDSTGRTCTLCCFRQESFCRHLVPMRWSNIDYCGMYEALELKGLLWRRP
jgi:hypothetical protein